MRYERNLQSQGPSPDPFQHSHPLQCVLRVCIFERIFPQMTFATKPFGGIYQISIFESPLPAKLSPSKTWERDCFSSNTRRVSGLWQIVTKNRAHFTRLCCHPHRGLRLNKSFSKTFPSVFCHRRPCERRPISGYPSAFLFLCKIQNKGQ